jgi:hypothetical protein
MGHVVQFYVAFSQQEGLDWLANNAAFPAGPPKPYYFLLNKWNAAPYIAQSGLPVQPDGTLTPNPQQWTDDPEEAHDFNVNSPTFQSDYADKASVHARSVAVEVIKKQTEKTQVPLAVLTDIRVELAVALTIAKQQRNFAFAAKILSIIIQLDSGRITKAQAIKLWTDLLANA